MTSGSLESQCMFYENSQCYFHAAFRTDCHICFNFSSAYRITERGKTKPFYTLFDYIRASGNRDIIFPKRDTFQQTF